MEKKYVKLQTEIPGPKSKEILERRNQFVPKGISNNCHSFVKKAQGALVEDVDGNIFIDFAGAIGTINVGHSHPRVVRALQEQASQFIHTGFNVMMYESYINLAERLANLAPGDFDKKVAFFNSGAEAVENAVKIARKYTKRQGIISFTRGFHGRTLMTMTMTSKVKPYKFGFGPFAPEVYKAPYPYVYRRPEGMSEQQYSDMIIEQFEQFLLAEVAPETIAAVVMEPVQGEGGFVVPDNYFVKKVKEICVQYGILFVADEIQTGFARTGKYFAIDHFGVVPDLITISKSMGAGVPISGVIGRTDIMEAADVGEIGGTYSGSPLGCRAALAVLDIIESENLNDRAEKIGARSIEKMKQLAERFECIGDVRGLGAMCAMEIVKDQLTKAPDKEGVGKIVKSAGERGLLLLNAGLYGNVIRLLMPLIISDEQLEEGLQILEEAFEAVYQKDSAVPARTGRM
ncbi:4-aminobutyrate--2-oxoglutarate transaminase [Neobacillus rhizophilus]|uniref:(S)-3-amino-2-methylpropionate transaminase n=1 Tax=Neobacillus rhizophilus TaxID=2833579 RepID=A0A942YX58_9BACI|nr:4-aminobutyrate--2-oxoglutarate transaminase [Neobacillus rhizophilus]MBS4213436.1 4-aminobutyrate--2-oxoglutarate transaminase [Neobacillus rhizophilus]MBU8914452.1 4-aminobutyrate--2-oxoglutarate transaminase [Bacillus sp. FJAT-29953]